MDEYPNSNSRASIVFDLKTIELRLLLPDQYVDNDASLDDIEFENKILNPDVNLFGPFFLGYCDGWLPVPKIRFCIDDGKFVLPTYLIGKQFTLYRTWPNNAGKWFIEFHFNSLEVMRY